MFKEIMKGAVYMLAGAVVLAAVYRVDAMQDRKEFMMERKAMFDEKMQGIESSRKSLTIKFDESMKHGVMQHHLHGADGKIIWQNPKDTVSLPVIEEEPGINIETPESVEDIRG